MNQEQLEKAKKLFFILLSVDTAITVISGINTYSTLGILKDIQSGTRRFTQDFITSLEFWEKFDGLMILTVIGVGLGLIKWLNSCYRFAKESIGAKGFKNEWWTAAGWIIPIFNFFKPYQVINEIYKAGSPNYQGADDWKKENGSGLLLTWWIFWAVTHFIMWIVVKETFKKSFRNDLTLSQVIGLYEFQILIIIYSIIIGILWFIVTGWLTQRLIERSAKPYNINSSVAHHQDDLYKKAYEEISTGQLETGSWAKAFANAEGNQDKAKAFYIKYRVEQLAALGIQESPQVTSLKSSSAQSKAGNSFYSENKNLIAFVAFILISGILAVIIIPAYLIHSNNILQEQSSLPTSNIGETTTSRSIPSQSESENKPVPTKQEKSSPVKPVELTEQEYYEESQKLFNNNDWTQLEEHCLKWVDKYPNNSNAWNLLGIAYAKNSKYDKAIESYQKALQIVPGDNVVLENIERTKFAYEDYIFSQKAKKYSDNNEWFALENYCVTWTKKYKNNPIAWNYLGYAYYNNGKYDKSLKAYKKALEFAPGNNSIMENIQAAQYAIQNVNSNNSNYEKPLNSKTPKKNCVINLQ